MTQQRKVDTRPPVKSYFDWDAITPVCKGCGRKSGRINDTSLCPACRGELKPTPVPAPAPKPAAPKPVRAAAPSRRAPKPPPAAPVRAARPAAVAPQTRGGSTPNTRGRRVDEAAIVQAYRAGATRPALAREHNVLRRRITAILQRHSVRLRDDRSFHSGSSPHVHSPELAGRVRELYTDRGLSRTEVAAELGIAPKTVATIMGRHGIPARQRQSGRSDGAKALRERIVALETTSAQIKAWALERGLVDQVKRGLCPARLVDAWEQAHR